MEDTNQPPAAGADHGALLYPKSDEPGKITGSVDSADHESSTQAQDKALTFSKETAVLSGQRPEPAEQVSEPQEQATLHSVQGAMHAAETSAPPKGTMVFSQPDTEQSKEKIVVREQNLGLDRGLELPETMAPVQSTGTKKGTPRELLPELLKIGEYGNKIENKMVSAFTKQNQLKPSPTPETTEGAAPQETSGIQQAETSGPISKGETQQAGVKKFTEVCRSL